MEKITKETYISISLALVLLSAIVFNEVRYADLKSQVYMHLSDQNIHHRGIAEVKESMSAIEEKFVSRNELSLQLEKIELKLERIEDKLK